MTRFLAAIIATLAVVIASSVEAAVFQYALPVDTPKGERTAFLWIPPEADHVRGLVVAGMTLAEREIVSDPRIRRACAESQLGILFFKSGLASVDVQHTLDRFAMQSGYAEIKSAPMLFIGHSAGGPQARKLARQFHNRCLGLVQYRGGDPGDVDHDGADRVFTYTPALMMIGQFDEFGKFARNSHGVENWEKDRDKLAALRRRGDRPVSIVVEPGAGHFGWSERSSKYLSLFITGATAGRLGGEIAFPSEVEVERDANNPFGAPGAAQTPAVEIIDLDVTSGWLTDLSIKPPLDFRATPHAKYAGETDKAMWHFNWHLAAATEAYHQGLDREDQFVVWKDRHTIEAGARNFFDEPNWVEDGQTFRVSPRYAGIFPTAKHERAKWARGGNAPSSGDPIEIRRAGGPIEKVGERTFRIRYDELAPATEDARITFMAFSRGNTEFRYTERVGMLRPSDCKVTEGEPQQIDFTPLADISVTSQPIPLEATSDSGLPVEYHVAYGPAKIVDNQLVIAELPKRAKYPIEVSVVAYQFGRAIEPKMRTATPVVQTIKLTK